MPAGSHLTVDNASSSSDLASRIIVRLDIMGEAITNRRTWRFAAWSTIALVAIGVSDCRKEPTAPGESTAQGRRDYTWKVDTIRAARNRLNQISGTSPDDLWAVLLGDANRALYHFDGVTWTSDMVARPFTPNSVFSVSTNDVWSGGLQGKIWHYDGLTWSEFYQHSVDSTSEIIFEAMYGTSPTNLYACGVSFRGQDYWGLILHFDGHLWRQVTIPTIRTQFVVMKFDGAGSGRYYLLGLSDEQNGPGTYQFYQFDGSTIAQIGSGTQGSDAAGDILQLGAGTRFIIGHNAYAYSSQTFSLVAHLADSPQFLGAGTGRNERDIFLTFLDGIAHFNGSDTQYLFSFDGYVRIVGSQIFERDIFFAGWDLKGNNLVFHGSLKP